MVNKIHARRNQHLCEKCYNCPRSPLHVLMVGSYGGIICFWSEPTRVGPMMLIGCGLELIFIKMAWQLVGFTFVIALAILGPTRKPTPL